MSIVRWGLLSTARINRRVIPAIRASARGRLVAVASRKQSVADAFASHWEIPRAFGSYESMLESGEIDAVYNPAESPARRLDGLRFGSGWHVLCEKPFAVRLGMSIKMIQAASHNGRALAEAFMYRHHPQTRQVSNGSKPDSGSASPAGSGCLQLQLTDPASNIRMRPEMGGGSLWDIGIYPLSFRPVRLPSSAGLCRRPTRAQ
jgi:predicted dehydrogenase